MEQTKSRILLLLACLVLAGTQVRAQQTPDQGSEQPPSKPSADNGKQDNSSSPAEAAAEKTKQVTLEAAGVTRKAGEMALVKARDWESGWLTGVYVGKDQPMVPLSGQQRGEYYLRQTLTTPGAYLKRMFAAGIDQARGVPSQAVRHRRPGVRPSLRAVGGRP